MDGPDGRALLPVTRRPALATILILAAVGAVFVGVGIRMAPSECKHRVERPTARGALLAYYADCDERPHGIRGPLSEPRNGWFAVENWALLHDGQVRFLHVGQKTPDSGWVVISEGTGP